MGIENRTSVYEFSPDPDLENIIRVWARKIGLAIRTATIGTVVSYNPTTQEASVTVDILTIRKVTQQTPGGVDPNEVNMTTAMAPVLLTEVPVITVGSGDSTGYLTFPIVPGCTGALLVLDRSRDTWVNRTAQVPVDPVKSAIHSLSDCVLVMGLTDRLHRITPPVDLTAAVLHHDTGIKLGRAAALGVARDTDAVGPSLAMAAWALMIETAITGAGGVIPPGTNFATTVQNSFASISGSSTKVKSE